MVAKGCFVVSDGGAEGGGCEILLLMDSGAEAHIAPQAAARDLKPSKAPAVQLSDFMGRAAGRSEARELRLIFPAVMGTGGRVDETIEVVAGFKSLVAYVAAARPGTSVQVITGDSDTAWVATRRGGRDW